MSFNSVKIYAGSQACIQLKFGWFKAVCSQLDGRVHSQTHSRSLHLTLYLLNVQHHS